MSLLRSSAQKNIFENSFRSTLIALLYATKILHIEESESVKSVLGWNYLSASGTKLSNIDGHQDHF